MVLNTLKNISVSALLILIVGCELPTTPNEPVDDLHGTTFVEVEAIDEIELHDGTYQTLYTMWGLMWSESYDVTHTRIEWESNMYWKVYDTDGYFKVDCRGCTSGTWYDGDGSTAQETLDLHTMAPVTNQVSLVNGDGEFYNVLAPVTSMNGKYMLLWWSTADAVIDSQMIYIN